MWYGHLVGNLTYSKHAALTVGFSIDIIDSVPGIGSGKVFFDILCAVVTVLLTPLL